MKKLFLALLFISHNVLASECSNLYVYNKPIVVKDAIELCNTAYVVAYSTKVKGPIVSFERFDSSKSSTGRINTFRADTRLRPNVRAELTDYLYSGYDRGHMTPAGDASNYKEMRESFLLSNMTPQSKKLNEGQWKHLEAHIREKSLGVTYIATGAIYGKETLGDNKIGIPTSYYKVVWYSDRTIEAYTALNRDDAKIIKVAIDDIVNISGVKFSY